MHRWEFKTREGNASFYLEPAFFDMQRKLADTTITVPVPDRKTLKIRTFKLIIR